CRGFANAARIFSVALLAKNVAVRLLKFRSIAIVSADLIRSHHSRGGLWPARNARKRPSRGNAPNRHKTQTGSEFEACSWGRVQDESRWISEGCREEWITARGYAQPRALPATPLGNPAFVPVGTGCSSLPDCSRGL